MEPMEELRIDLGDRSYPIFIGERLDDRLDEWLADLRRSNRKIAVIADENIARLHSGWLRMRLGGVPTWVVPAGESSKSIAYFGQGCDFQSRF